MRKLSKLARSARIYMYVDFLNVSVFVDILSFAARHTINNKKKLHWLYTYADVHKYFETMKIIIYVSEALARAYKLYVRDLFFIGIHLLGLVPPPPPPPHTKKLAIRYILLHGYYTYTL